MSVIIEVKVIKPGQQAEDLLDLVADYLDVVPDRQMAPEVAKFWFDGVGAVEAHALVVAALDSTGGDWADYLLLGRSA